MAEQSYFWNTSGIGDGSATGFARDKIAAWLKNVFSSGLNGILDRIGNELEATGASSPLSVDTGAAIVDGLFYYNDAAATVTVSTPASGTTGGRIVLRASWSAQTVRIAAVLNTDGVADIPALTQTSGTTFEINLATFTITTGGVIENLTVETGRAIFSSGVPAGSMIMSALSVLGNATNAQAAAQEIAAASDGQVMRRSGTSIGFGTIPTAAIADLAAITAKIAGGAIDDTKLGDRVPQFYRRQGGSETNWDTPGSTSYTPGKIRIQAGSSKVTISAGLSTGYALITLPVTVSHPLIFVGVKYIADEINWRYYDLATTYISTSGLSEGYFKVYAILRNLLGMYDTYVYFSWMAIGPEPA